MNNHLLQLKNNLKSSNENNKYLYVDYETKFIYKDSSRKQIVGINHLLQNSIIEIIEEKIFDEARFAFVKCKDEEIGWLRINANSLIKLYRLPKINGKIDSIVETEFNEIKYDEELAQLHNKIIKAFYFLKFNNESYLLIGKIDGTKTIPLKIRNFNRLIQLEEGQTVSLLKGEPLYRTSNYQNKISEIDQEGNYQVFAFINGTKQVRIKIKDIFYWTTASKNMPNVESIPEDTDTLDIMDFLTYLYENNRMYQEENKILNNKLKKIQDNIVYSNKKEEINVKKYLGDVHGG